MAELADLLAEHKHLGVLRPAAEESARSCRLAPFQSAVWKLHLADMDRLAHANPLSLVPILLFLLRKRREVQVVRAVARGKAAGLSEERLRELIL